ncbi:MAG: elongation factor G [Candidatus Brocadiae bacterium]|nr:elongation factor G [Candidatus Brocadiia bacterium]
MAKRTTSAICNVAVVGHGSVGKTTLVDHLLHVAGFAKRAGDVDSGSSLSDHEPEEKERRFSINSTIFHFEAQGRVFNLIDTPGYLDFAGAAAGVLPVVETALIAISARDGIQLNTRRMWQAAGELGLARILLITRLDGENIMFDKLLAEIQEAFGGQCRPAFLPLGLGHECRGVVNLLDTEEAPEGVIGDFDAARESILESVIECDDALMERYFEGEQISPQEITTTLRRAVAAGSVVPVLCCVAKADIGVAETLDFLANSAPSPAEGPVRKATDANDEEAELTADPDGPFCARVFKAATDVHVGKVAYFRVYSGSLSGGLSVQLARIGKAEKLGHIYLIKGQEQEETDIAIPGDMLCVTKFEELQIDDTLCGPGAKLTLPPTSFPSPMTSLAVETHSRDDDQKVSAGLQSLAEGDPTFTMHRDTQSGEVVITGMSNLHLEVMLSKLQRRYETSVGTHQPSIPYREAITTASEGQYRHKKQTGGRGQYGEVYLRLEPNEGGAGFEFIDKVVGGAIPRQFIPAVEKGVREVLDKGPLGGYPIVDVKATVHYGTYHSVDSSEAAFRIAAARAFREAFQQGKPVLLEPIAEMEVTIPSEFMGDVTGNLTGHRARILGMDQVGQMQVIRAEIPMAEVTRYSTELKSMTGGEGSFTLQFSRYQAVPAHIQQDIVARAQKKEE